LSEIALEKEPTLFAALQRADDRALAGEGAGGEAAVQLSFDDGAYLQVVDGKGRPRSSETLRNSTH
jgi:hypothetical protein